MGMSTHIIAIGEPGDKHSKMFAAYEACSAAGLDVPKEVNEYFNWDSPNEKGLEIDIEEHGCCTEFSEDSRHVFEIDLKSLPEGITHIRFFNSH